MKNFGKLSTDPTLPSFRSAPAPAPAATSDQIHKYALAVTAAQCQRQRTLDYALRCETRQDSQHLTTLASLVRLTEFAAERAWRAAEAAGALSDPDKAAHLRPHRHLADQDLK